MSHGVTIPSAAVGCLSVQIGPQRFDRGARVACEAVRFTGLSSQQSRNKPVDDGCQAIGRSLRRSLGPQRTLWGFKNGRADYEAPWRSDDTSEEQSTATELASNLQHVGSGNIGSLGKAGATPRTHDG